MILCKDIKLSSHMEDLVLVFRNGNKIEELSWPLPPTKVLARDPETGEPTKTSGPFKNGKLRWNLILKYIHDAVVYYYGPDCFDAIDKIWEHLKDFEAFPSKFKVAEWQFRTTISKVEAWCEWLRNCRPEHIDAFLLHRSLVRTFNSWASGKLFDDRIPGPTPKEAEEEDNDETL